MTFAPEAGRAGAELNGAALLDAMLEACVAFDDEGHVVGWNRAAEEMLGWSPLESLGLTAGELGPLWGDEPVGRASVQADPGRWRAPRRVEVRHREGHGVPALVRLSVLPGAGHDVVCAFLADDRDAAAARAKAACADSFNETLLESLQVGVLACDLEGRLVVANRALRDLHGLPPMPGVGPPDPEIFADALERRLSHPDGSPMTLAESPLFRARDGEPVDGVAVRLAGPDGPARDLEVTARPLCSPAGDRLGAVAVLQEVTKRQRRERFQTCELLAARALAEATSVADVGPALVRAVARALGWPHAQLWLVDEVTDTLRLAGRWDAPGFVLDTEVPPEIRRGWGIAGTVWATGEPLWIPDVLDTDQVPCADFPARARSSAASGVQAVVAVPVRDGRDVLGVLTAVADHRERHGRQLVSLLGGVANQVGHFLVRRRAEDLALQLARTKDDYLALVGLRMRTPLAAIARCGDLLASAGPTWTAGERELVASIGRDVGTLHEIIEDVLDLAAIDGGTADLRPCTVDFAALIADAVAAATPAAAANRVDLRASLPPRLELRGDPGRLRQIADNLLTNAVKYSPDGGDVYVRLGAAVGAAELTIVDTGIGIPAVERDRLFSRFYRASTARDRGIPGTGLGLTLTRALAEAHGGTVTITHQHGTTVTVRLPLTGV